MDPSDPSMNVVPVPQDVVDRVVETVLLGSVFSFSFQLLCEKKGERQGDPNPFP